MKILAITDMDETGSGYRNVCIPLFVGLTKLGHEIKVAGMSYRGTEHWFPFSILPAQGLADAEAIAINMFQLWQPDILLVALDIPLQIQMHSKLAPYLARTPDEINAGKTTPRKYVAITPLENGPLTMSWAAPLMNMDAIFFISELGKQEAIKAGVKQAEHIVIGVDTESWKPATPEEKQKLREGLGIPPDAFVVLTVADNQERKNLSASMGSVCMFTHDTMTYEDFKEIVKGNKKASDFPKTNTNVKYILVTREQSPFGWRLRDLAVSLDINQEYMPFERGVPVRDLWGLYAVSDVYLQPSKAEGLGLPVLDAMATGIPVVATDTGAMHELLENRGFLIPSEYTFTDVWGNSKRDMMSIEHARNALKSISLAGSVPQTIPLEYVRSRTWDIPVQQVHNKIMEILNEQKL